MIRPPQGKGFPRMVLLVGVVALVALTLHGIRSGSGGTESGGVGPPRSIARDSEVPAAPDSVMAAASYQVPELPPADELVRGMSPRFAQMIDPVTDPGVRLDLVRGIGNDFTEVEALLLLHELANAPRFQADEARHSTYIHLICGKLQDLPAHHSDFAGLLGAMAADRELPEVFRDYAFQHLRILWHRTRDTAADPEDPQALHSRIEQILRELSSLRPEVRTQSILALHELTKPGGEFVVGNEEAYAMARDLLATKKDAGDRMVAVRILLERPLDEAHGILRSLAADPDEHSLVRASAMGALGHLGSPEDRQFLDALQTSDPMLLETLRVARSAR